LNSQGTTSFYRFPIPDPRDGVVVNAPYISYSREGPRPEVSVTYGKGYHIYKRPLEATAVEYCCPPITPEQLRIFDPKESFAFAVDKVVNEYFPLDLSSALRHYQHYKEGQYTMEQVANQLRDKQYHYLEKAVKVLDELENANVLGRLLAHSDVLEMTMQPNTQAIRDFHNATKDFQGHITQSALDTAINHSRSSDSALVPSTATSESDSQTRERTLKQQLLTARNEKNFLLSKQEPPTAPRRRTLHSAPVRCFRCRRIGHYRADCKAMSRK
jgi:hypothetical protein